MQATKNLEVGLMCERLCSMTSLHEIANAVKVHSSNCTLYRIAFQCISKRDGESGSSVSCCFLSSPLTRTNHFKGWQSLVSLALLEVQRFQQTVVALDRQLLI